MAEIFFCHDRKELSPGPVAVLAKIEAKAFLAKIKPFA